MIGWKGEQHSQESKPNRACGGATKAPTALQSGLPSPRRRTPLWNPSSRFAPDHGTFGRLGAGDGGRRRSVHLERIALLLQTTSREDSVV